MNDEPRKTRVVRAVPGAPLAPEPHPAKAWDELPAEVYELIEKKNPQDQLSKGRVVEAINW